MISVISVGFHTFPHVSTDIPRKTSQKKSAEFHHFGLGPHGLGPAEPSPGESEHPRPSATAEGKEREKRICPNESERVRIFLKAFSREFVHQDVQDVWLNIETIAGNHLFRMSFLSILKIVAHDKCPPVRLHTKTGQKSQSPEHQCDIGQ